LHTSQGYIIRISQHFGTKLWNITNFVMLFQAVMKFLSRLVVMSSKFWLIGEWSITTAKQCILKVQIIA
jgi:valyl-tRNA synthetase